ncbi:sensor histidine kinase [Poseidonibacter ostreae]|uniref:histidine kinase n=1 Tax=Poseidonibacter ostreae TaxID=2654171 RepID=A0A6L4WR56_9BACT|nr:cache domain-containing protein [Poseidonibacter ostreae]KAB7887251.1 GHKL domain-containing protein [Poseidonibacter ostreae]KAB7888308.1 GHKL domain-containing protein [Poseidonibacter ostreae]KAB7889522.1 GHKL domain-containing protein [Poseidonibacter ostreae]MAC82916.1 histidine kinase [Arcobacter sp.]
MFSEKNLPKLIILTPIITVILIAFFTLYFFVKNQNDYFEEESVRVETEYINKQKEILKKEITYIINYIEHHVSRNKTLKESELKKEILKYIETIRYGKHGYIWVHDTNYYLKAHPFRENNIGALDISLKDAMGTLITKQFIDETIKSPNGKFIEYYWQKPKELHASKKLGFFRLYEKYNWVIGTGLYIDDIQKTIFEDKKLLEDRINKYIRLVLVFSFLIILIIGIISFLISREITQAFKKYQDSVQKKEFLLEDLNKNLELKVKKAIIDVKKKDRAMFHQSRLARMGTMLSMIAHQWRQPLSEVSGILMELETANKFNKVDSRMIESSVSDSNKLISFMSNTIDDFRNFFKPDKQKVEFYIEDACNEAITLVDASIKNFNIKLTKDVKNNSLIKGYKREFAQVMLNLISNAKDALKQREIKHPLIKITLDSKDTKVIITVEDNAGGIKEAYISSIFDPYFTTKEGLKGTGLGLYMSKMIIEKNMNGELHFENTKQGALFTIILEC